MNKQEFMAMSLPYGLKVLRADNKTILEISGIHRTSIMFTERYTTTYGSITSKPILHPLSDLTKVIEYNGEKFVPIDLLRQDGYYIGEDWIIENFKDVENSSFGFIQKLIEWHFDAAKLIEKGEAIDVNNLKKNPYK